VISPQEILVAALKTWRTALVNLDGRNPLLYYKSTSTMKGIVRPKKGMVDFRIHTPAGNKLDDLLSGKSVSASDFHLSSYQTRDQTDEMPELEEELDETVGRRKRGTQWSRLLTSYEEVVRKARENLEERNIETLYLVRGFISWKPDGPGPSEPLAPLILIPLKIESKGRGHTDFQIRINGDPIFNDALRLYLQMQLSMSLEDLGITTETEFDSLDDIATYFAPLAKSLPKGKIEGIQLIGNFSFFKLPLVTDIDRILEQGLAHPILAALSGDETALELIAPVETESEIDRISDQLLKEEFLVFPTDRSQHLALSAITRGKTIVIQGPPGTGKSQTIANVIAELSAMGKKTLFVAEKRAAIEAVVSRLTNQGLSSLVLDLHSEPDKKRIASQLLEVLFETNHKSAGMDSFAPELQEVKDRLQKRWQSLSAGSGIVFEHEEELSVYAALQALGKLIATLPEEIAWPREIDRKLLLDVPAIAARTMKEALNTLSASKWLDGETQHIGRGLLDYVFTQDQVLELSTHLETLESGLLGDYKREVKKFEADNGYKIGTLDECKLTLESVKTIDSMRQQWDLHRVSSALNEYAFIWRFSDLRKETGSGNVLKAFLLSRTRQKVLFGLYQGKDRLKRATLTVEMLRLGSALRVHQRFSKDDRIVPVPASDLFEMIVGQIFNAFQALSAYGPLLTDLSELTLDSLNSRMEMLYSELPLIGELPSVNISRERIIGLGIISEDILTWAEDEQPELKAVGEWFIRWWMETLLDKTIAAKNLELKINEPGSLDQILYQYQNLDERHIANNAGRTHAMVRERALQISDTAGFTKLRREADKKGAHWPFRKLMEEAREEVQTLKPCFAMSPISVSRMLPCEYGLFDVVIFDEASQISPEDAIPSIYRAKQLVVAGDRYQLGPTDVGRASDEMDDYLDEDGEVEIATKGLESILDSLRGVLPISSTYALQTHYRSQDERLITFSNKAFYIPNNQALVSFPSREANPRKALGYVFVEGVQTKSVREESNTKEILAVLDEVLAHVASRPEDSLGIIAFGDQHKRRIEDALLKLEHDNDSYFDFVGRFASQREPLFVKSIERVQGDERDCIIISPGYARGDKGTLRYQFGSLGRQGGERRLNVAASRAKKKFTIVTSITSSDFDAYRGQERGVRLFKALLQYMETYGHSSDLGDIPAAPENPFEDQILQSLTKRGLLIDCQVGDSGYRIDFAVRHPDKEDEYVLAIEADGASYHGSDYARERDIIRQRVLKNRGWKFVRIWSTDWFRNRGGEIEKVVEAYKSALLSDSLTASSSIVRVLEDEATEQSRVPVDERLFKGLMQSKSDLPKEVIFEEWMQLCGYKRKVRKVLERFEELWRGSGSTRVNTKAYKFTENQVMSRGFRFVAWIRADEIAACGAALKFKKDQTIPWTGSTPEGSVLFTYMSTCFIYRIKAGERRLLAVLTEPEVRVAAEAILLRQNQLESMPGEGEIFVEYIASDLNLNLSQISVRIYRK
jgi:very-short-patch-repair endonuclease